MRDAGELDQALATLKQGATNNPSSARYPTALGKAWCHQRGYVCLIEEIGGRPIRAGESFGAAFIVGFFDSIEEMEKVYDRYAGHTGVEVGEQGWKLIQ